MIQVLDRTKTPSGWLNNPYEASTETIVPDTIEQEKATHSSSKPFLPAPVANPLYSSVSVFYMFLQMIKDSMESESGSFTNSKKQIEKDDLEMQELVRTEAVNRREAAEKEKQANRWGILAKIASWFANIFSIVAGVVICATGAGALAGGMLIAAGVVGLGSQIMETAGGWKKIKELLPGDDDSKKEAVCTWIQIAISVLGLILAGVSFGVGAGGPGISVLGSALTTVFSTLGGITQGATAIAGLGTTVNKFLFNDKLVDAKKVEKEIIYRKYLREDAQHSLDLSLQRLLEYFQMLSKHFLHLEEMFHADQSIIRAR